MPTDRSLRHADLMRRLDELPISAHERRTAKSNAALAFGLVDAFADAFGDLRALFAPSRRQATRVA